MVSTLFPRPRAQLLRACSLVVPWCSGSDVLVPRQGLDIGSEDRHAQRVGMNSPSPCKADGSSPCPSQGRTQCRCYSGSASLQILLGTLPPFGLFEIKYELADIQEAVFLIRECCHATRARWSTPRCHSAMPLRELESDPVARPQRYTRCPTQVNGPSLYT